MTKKRCSHIGRISKKRDSGSIVCLRLRERVQIKVGDTHNVCICKECYLSGKQIPRQDE